MAEQAEKTEKGAKAEKPDKPEKGAKGEKAAKPDKGPRPEKAAKGEKAVKGEKAEKAEPSAPAEPYFPRLRTKYREEVVPALVKEFGYRNVMQVPRLAKIVVNIGLGEAIQNPKAVEEAVDQLTQIVGQKPVVTKAKKSISAFKLREGVKIGAKVTLRGGRMWDFFDRLVSLAVPRVRDFKGISPRLFDGRGNFTIGLKEQIIFPEINYDRIDKIRGMNITIVTTAKTDEEARAFLKLLGMPFRAN